MAAAFRFRLETVERIRRRERDTHRRSVAEAIREVQRVEATIEAFTKRLTESITHTRDAQRVGRVDMTGVRGHEYYRGELHRSLAENDRQLAAARDALDGRRRELDEASKRYKAIEKLREKHRAQYIVSQRRQEQSRMDEASLQLYVRGAILPALQTRAVR